MHLFPVKPVVLFNYNNSFPGGERGAGSLGERSYSAPNPPFGATRTRWPLIRSSAPPLPTLPHTEIESIIVMGMDVG